MIYSELRNFTFEKSGEELWVIRLNEDFELFDAKDNLMLEQKNFATVELSFRTRGVSDLFVRNTISLTGAPPGDYTIKIVVTDVPSGKKADLVVPISIKE